MCLHVLAIIKHSSVSLKKKLVIPFCEIKPPRTCKTGMTFGVLMSQENFGMEHHWNSWIVHVLCLFSMRALIAVSNTFFELYICSVSRSTGPTNRIAPARWLYEIIIFSTQKVSPFYHFGYESPMYTLRCHQTGLAGNSTI